MPELAVRGQWTVAERATGIEPAWPAWKAGRETDSHCGALVLSDEVWVAERIGRIQLFIEPAGHHTEHPLPRLWRDQHFQPEHETPHDDTLAVITR